MIVKALGIIALILGWICLSLSPIKVQLDHDKYARTSMLLLGIGTLCTMFASFS